MQNAQATAAADEVRAVVGDVLDRGGATWSAAADAGLLGLGVPEDLGGEGLGPAEVAVLVHEAAVRGIDLPFRHTVLTGLPTLLAGGDDSLSAELVPEVLAGRLHLVPAVTEPGTPDGSATTYADGTVTGRKAAVPVLEGLTRLLVSTDRGVAVVDPAGPGVARTGTPTSDDASEAAYSFEGAPGRLLDPAATDGLREHRAAGLLLHGVGLLVGARDLTARHVSERRQFGRRLAELQAVALQVADVHVVARTAQVATDEVVRRLAAGQPVGDDLAVAAAWFADRAPRALQTCHHLHGGTGVDVTYPLHRHFAGVKDVVRQLGGRAATLARAPVQEHADAKNLELDDAQRRFKDEAREYFAGLLTEADRDEIMVDRHGPAYHRAIKQMGNDGWLGVGWPTEHGGRGLGGVEQQAFANEAARADVHLPSVTLQTVGPTLQAFGTPAQKERFLADILTGDVHFAIGYSETEAGTDLASLRCSARKDPATGDWIVNGQKMWTTGGHTADHVWLAVRTDPDAPKHKGISVLIVDTDDPGYSWTPIVTCDGSHHVNATSYDDVRVPADMLVGEENEGWRLITTQLNHERVMLGPAGRIEGLRDRVVDWARERATPDGTPLLEVPAVRDALARATVAFRVNELLNWEVARAEGDPRAAVADASVSKVLASDEVQRVGLELEEAVTTYGDPADPATARLARYLDATSKRNLVLTFGGGVNEVQRELIATFGLGLPKVPR